MTYLTGTVSAAPELTWLDRTGKTLGTVGKPATYGDLALARDGRRAIVSASQPLRVVI